MSRAGFEYVLDKHVCTARTTCSSLGKRPLSPHQLRHSCALMMLQATRDIRKVALWLGHSDIRTTEIYLRIDPSEKLEAVEAVLPLACVADASRHRTHSSLHCSSRDNAESNVIEMQAAVILWRCGSA